MNKLALPILDAHVCLVQTRLADFTGELGSFSVRPLVRTRALAYSRTVICLDG